MSQNLFEKKPSQMFDDERRHLMPFVFNVYTHTHTLARIYAQEAKKETTHYQTKIYINTLWNGMYIR